MYRTATASPPLAAVESIQCVFGIQIIVHQLRNGRLHQAVEHGGPYPHQLHTLAVREHSLLGDLVQVGPGEVALALRLLPMQKRKRDAVTDSWWTLKRGTRLNKH